MRKPELEKHLIRLINTAPTVLKLWNIIFKLKLAERNTLVASFHDLVTRIGKVKRDVEAELAELPQWRQEPIARHQSWRVVRASRSATPLRPSYASLPSRVE